MVSPGVFRCFHPWAQVSVDNIDRDLFGRAVRGAMYQPSDATLHRHKTVAHDLVRAAYADDLVRSAYSGSHACPASTPALYGQERHS